MKFFSFRQMLFSLLALLVILAFQKFVHIRIDRRESSDNAPRRWYVRRHGRALSGHLHAFDGTSIPPTRWEVDRVGRTLL